MLRIIRRLCCNNIENVQDPSDNKLVNYLSLDQVDLSNLKVESGTYLSVPCKVIKLVDADTIDVAVFCDIKQIYPKSIIYGDAKICRLLRIRVSEFDSAEMSTYEGKVVKYIMELYIETANSIGLKLDSTNIDKYGRTLGDIYVVGSSGRVSLSTMLCCELKYYDRNGKIKRGVLGNVYHGDTKSLDSSNFSKEKKTLQLDEDVKRRLREIYPNDRLLNALNSGIPYRPK